jgi:hypothetical protein
MSSFERFVESRHDLNRNYISVFGSAFACPRYAGAGQRHHLPIFCALIVESSAPMCKKPIKTPICQDTCREALFGLAELFENRQICDGSLNNPRLAKSERLRRETLAAYTNLCKSLKIKNTSQGHCVDGVNAQLGQSCGKESRVHSRDSISDTRHCELQVSLRNRRPTNFVDEMVSHPAAGL